MKINGYGTSFRVSFVSEIGSNYAMTVCYLEIDERGIFCRVVLTDGNKSSQIFAEEYDKIISGLRGGNIITPILLKFISAKCVIFHRTLHIKHKSKTV